MITQKLFAKYQVWDEKPRIKKNFPFKSNIHKNECFQKFVHDQFLKKIKLLSHEKNQKSLIYKFREKLLTDGEIER